jgi:peptide/nickel transport system substrate-binding protein
MQHRTAGEPARRRRAVSTLVAATLGLGVLAALGTGGPAGAADKVTFTVGTEQDIDTINPINGVEVIDYEIWNLQYATLTDKAAKDFAVIPGLAESWEISDDGLTVTYKLRDGLKWSDGEPLTAEDVAYTINRSRDEEWVNYTSVTANLDAEAVDDTTVKITSSVPDPKLPVMDVYILPKHVYEKLDADAAYEYDAQDGVGSGPFTVSDVRKGELVRMAKNPNWYGQEPAMDEVIFRIFDTVEGQYQALKTGEIDAVDDVPVEIFVGLDGSGGIEPIAGTQGDFSELAMNAGCGTLGDGHPALKDQKVRQAINYAIDRDLLVEKVINGLGTRGVGLPVSANPAWDLKLPDDQQFLYDPDKAKTLLDEAGWKDTNGDGTRDKDGKELVLRLFNRPTVTGPPLAEFTAGWLKDVGIGTKVSEYDDAQLTAVIGKGEYDLFIWGWTPFVDPDPMLSYFTSDQVTTDPEVPLYNDANWCNDEYDQLYEQQKVELDPAKRMEIVQQMLKIFYEDAPYVVFYKYDVLQGIRNDRWTNFVRQPAETGPVLFTNTSPAYVQLQRVAGSDSGGSNAGLIIGVAAAGVAVLAGVGLWTRSRRRKSEDDERE